jgi:hypothetical protein
MRTLKGRKIWIAAFLSPLSWSDVARRNATCNR